MRKPKDKLAVSLQHFGLVVWLIDTLRHVPPPGLTFAEIQEKWAKHSQEKILLVRSRFDRHREYASLIFGIDIACPNRKHYRIMNPDSLSLDTLADDLLASVQEYLLIDQFRCLGPRLQPAEILAGRHYLTSIAKAIKDNRKLAICYQKFTDSEPYKAIIHPYILKALQGRWYVAAHKENSTHANVPVQMFALDRTLSLQVMDDTFEYPESLDASTFFDDFYGAYIDNEAYPVADVYAACDSNIAPYLRTLPLHKSQQEIETFPIPFHCPETWKGAVFFKYHISPTKDFIGALMQWGESLIYHIQNNDE